MAEIKLNIYVITINVHGLNALFKSREFSILREIKLCIHMRHTFKNREIGKDLSDKL